MSFINRMLARPMPAQRWEADPIEMAFVQAEHYARRCYEPIGEELGRPVILCTSCGITGFDLANFPHTTVCNAQAVITSIHMARESRRKEGSQ